MPYIPQDDRNSYIGHLEDLLHELAKQGEEDLGGHFNFCISYLLKRLWEDKRRYVRANTLRGAVENALIEWYRCSIIKYEESKRHENGDV